MLVHDYFDVRIYKTTEAYQLSSRTRTNKKSMKPIIIRGGGCHLARSIFLKTKLKFGGENSGQARFYSMHRIYLVDIVDEKYIYIAIMFNTTFKS